ncbi:MAG: M43 family zinc metalloprotease [Chitinophagaceae bacterium]
MKKIFLILFFSLSVCVIIGQPVLVEKRECGISINWPLLKNNPSLYRAFLDREAKTKKNIDLLRQQLSSVNNIEYEIPVVFHIVLSDPSVITDQIIKATIDTLNVNFQGRNSDSTNAPLFYSKRGRTSFKFVLAKYSPEGCDTNGITRKISPLTYSDDQIKSSVTGGTNKWDAPGAKYLNIWIGSLIDVFGYAYWPDYPGISEDVQGVVVDYRTLPWPGGLPGFNLGRTLIHEVGHYFNLRHIWGDEAGCATDDGVIDTPVQDDASSGATCPNGPVFDACQPIPTLGIMYQNHMDYTRHNCRTMFTNDQCLRMLEALLNAPNRSKLIDPENKALKKPKENTLFNTCNTPAFETNLFNTICVGKHGTVWAGTSNLGLYRLKDTVWEKFGAYSNNFYQDMKADRQGGILIAQSGFTGAQANTGGVLYFPDSSFAGYAYYGALAGLPSRNARSIYVDTSRYNGPTFLPVVWTANYAQITGGVSGSGGIGRGLNPASPNFSAIRTGVDVALNGGGTFYIGGDATEIWSFANANFGKSQILRHNAVTNAFIGAYDTTNVFNGKLSGQFAVKSIYFDAKGKKWITVNNEGLMVLDAGIWTKVKSTSLFGAVPFFNNNGITGDTAGNVYIGTNNGLVMYKAGFALGDTLSYKKYTTSDGLPSNNIRGICTDTLRKKILLATDNGIVFWEPVCTQNINALQNTFSTSATGTWGVAATWCNGSIPDANTNVIVKHAVTVTANTEVKSLKVIPPGTVTVSAGVSLKILNQ